MRVTGLIVGAALSLAAGRADAALILSADSNIFDNFGATAPNQQFVKNIAGAASILVQTNTRNFLSTQAGDVVTYLNGNGYAASLLSANATLTSADLLGKSLYVAYARNNAFSTTELTAISAFLLTGGNVLLTGENASSTFTDLNTLVNNALTGLGSGMRIVPALNEVGFQTATIVTPNAITAGTAGFRYAAPSVVSGGTGLYASGVNGSTFVAFEGSLATAVPEPVTWTMLVAGFGLAGGAMRRRPKVRVSFAAA